MTLLDEVHHCELCGYDRGKTEFGQVQWALHEHHIMRGPWRLCSTGKRFANLVLCYSCHIERIHGNEHWPESRQLALLRSRRPADSDLKAYNELKGYGPDRITVKDLDKWL